MTVSKWWLIGLVVATVAGCSKAPVPRTINSQAVATTTPTPLPAPNEVWMTEFQQIDGTSYLYAPIYVAAQEQRIIKQLKSAASDSYEGRNRGADIRNYMFVHKDNLSASKLLTNNSSRLLEMEQLGATTVPASPADSAITAKAAKAVTALWHLRVLADTNGDKTLNESDRKQIAISDASGANYTEIIRDIDKILLVYPKGLDRRLVIYTSGTKRFVADVNIPNRRAITKELPPLN